MGFDKKSLYNWILVVIIIVCLGLLIFQNVDAITGKATSGTAVSNVTISTYFSIELSANLLDGIEFGTVTNLTSANNINATNNNDTQQGNQTSFWINVSTDSNTRVDFCLGANADMWSSGGDFINITNESYGNSTVNNRSYPALSQEVSITAPAAGAKAGTNISIGGVNFYRFWLDIPPAQAAGTYNNSISFTGKQVTVAC